MNSALYWEILSTVANWVSAVAIVAGAVFVVVELRQAAKDRYLHLTSDLFQIWHSREFQDDQLFVLHKLPNTNWKEFIANGRGADAERALQRVGGFYDRIGHLIRTKLIRQEEILPTVGGDAIRVWQKIEPLVREARQSENSLLFQNYEAVLPNCLECYVPIVHGESKLAEAERIEPADLKKMIDAANVVVLDVSKASEEKKVRGAIRAAPNDLVGWIKVIPPGKDVVTYCTCMNEASGVRAAQQLIQAGIRNVKVLRGGLESWEKAGYEIESANIAEDHPRIVQPRGA